MPSLIYIERSHLFVRVIACFSLELHRYSRDVPNSPSLCSLYRCQQCWFYVTELVSLTCTHTFSNNSTRVNPYIPRRGRCTVIFYTWIVWILPKCVILKTHNLPNWQRAAFFFCPHCAIYEIPVPWPGIEPVSSCTGNAESQSLDHQGSPKSCIFKCVSIEELISVLGLKSGT